MPRTATTGPEAPATTARPEGAALAARLRQDATPADGARRSATHLLTGYSGGALLAHPAVREHIGRDEPGRYYVRWGALTEATNTAISAASFERTPLRDLHTLHLACSLALAGTSANIGAVISLYGPADRKVLAEAITIALTAQH